MKILKVFYSIILWLFMPMVSLAVNFELTDVIREARETQMQIAAKSQIKENVEQIKQQYSQNGEQSAIEKINPSEIMQQETQNK